MPLRLFHLVAQTRDGEEKCYAPRSSGVVQHPYLIVPSRLRRIHFGSKGENICKRAPATHTDSSRIPL